MNAKRNLSKADKQLQIYYDQIDTHNFYQKISGREHIDIGLYEHPNEDLEAAKKRIPAEPPGRTYHVNKMNLFSITQN